jgi:hypothetical protein
MNKKHLYNTRFGKVRWFVARFGASEILLKPIRTVCAPVIIPLLKPAKFPFKGEQLNYFYHAYNMTWASERGIEVPIARRYLEKSGGKVVLEVGNVLSHYGPIRHEVLDKFEKGPGVINEDIISFQPEKRYDLILSISTFEHIGFDDETESSSAEKILEAIGACRRLLHEDGRLVITVPISYNPELNTLILQDSLGYAEGTFLKRTGHREWRECSKSEALTIDYKRPFPYANAILVAEFARGT